MDTDTLLVQAIEIGKEKGYVDVVKMVNDLGIGVLGVRGRDDDFNAEIQYDKEKERFKIYVNEVHTVERQRFSIAHELGHYVFHPDELKKKGKLDRSGSSKMEAEADQFAADILMPKPLVKGYIKSQGFKADDMDRKVVVSIANKFKVSKAMTIIRLRELDYNVPFIQFS